ncbi:uncharacterized protein B0I36DRAFT_313921 [Microdochium trichocladiopsis]|uniref:Uncharacterized protein n=1 Tax=Microdochium trichocladiopsis TaxID=1682393 RepID=A0A9P8YG15_9PEZI|nr:uncharacterized protein B0I36DRAFT_313921 [Microdochium trichocladiopsis]KAH7037380.1 hypothetical protein B0I36DRAFT_313921 [Microdochium trichocladiopsis]
MPRYSQAGHGRHQTEGSWPNPVEATEPYSHYSLRSVRSHESPLDAQRPRSAQPPHDIRTSKLRSPTLTAVGTRHEDVRMTQSWRLHTPLQEEIHRAVIEQRAKERLEDEIDALLRAREDAYHPRRAANKSIGRLSLGHLRGTSTSSFGTSIAEPSHTELVEMADETKLAAELLIGNLHQIEPLMQELAESARLSQSESDTSMAHHDELEDYDLTPHADRNLYTVY